MKEKLNSCVTFKDSHEVLSSMDSWELVNYINALNRAKEYIDLTMRDTSLLSQAEAIYTSRGYKL
jgi:hypothetical protein